MAGWRRVGALLHHLVTLLTDRLQPLVLQGGREEEVRVEEEQDGDPVREKENTKIIKLFV